MAQNTANQAASTATSGIPILDVIAAMSDSLFGPGGLSSQALDFAFGDERARKAAALQDSNRINPWLLPRQAAKQDKTLLIAVAIVAVVTVIAFVLRSKKT